MRLFCEKIKDTGKYRHFFKSKIAVGMCCDNKANIVEVIIQEVPSGKGTHWAFKVNKDNSYRFIYESKLQVNMCSPDFFKHEIESGQGKIVEVTIKEI